MVSAKGFGVNDIPARVLRVICCCTLAALVGHPLLAHSESTDEAPATHAYFGDLHIHTSWSFDAYISRVRTTPSDAYRLGVGEAIPLATGGTAQLSRPLELMAGAGYA